MEGLSEKLLKLIPNFARSFGVLTIIAIASGGLVLSFFAKTFDEEATDLSTAVFKVLAENFDSIEEKFYDWRNNYYLFEENNKEFPPKKLTKGPIFIDIDDKSLTEIGTFPLPREYYIQMLDKLEQFGAKVVAFDVLFPEKSLSCDMGDGKTVDDLFAERVASFNASDKAGSVVLAFTAQENVEPIEPDIVLLSSILSARGLYDQAVTTEDGTLIEATKITTKVVEKGLFPFRELADTDSTFGFLNMKEDRDGVFRHYAIFARVMSEEILEGSMLLPSLGLQAYMASLDQNELNFEIDQFSTTTLNINNKNLYIDDEGEVKIKWIGNRFSYPAISFMDLLTAKKPEDLKNKYLIDDYIDYQETLKKTDLTSTKRKEIEKNLKQIEPFVTVDLKDKIVFVASSSTGYHDLRNTPVDGTMPGVYAHMTVTHMLQNQNFFQDSGDSIVKSGYLLFGTLTILLVVMFFNKAVLDLLTLMVLLIGSFFLDQYYFLPESYEMRLGVIFFALIATYSWITFLNFNQASAEKKQIKGAFSRYVAPAIVDDMLDNPDKLKVGGERKDITCLFSDVRDFTSISEKLTPTALAGALNRYMGEMTDIVFATNGTLDKYIGDAIVAFWGAPVDIGDHVNQAMDAAVKMLEALPAINEEFKAKNLPEFKIGLGLNSGECNVGNMGSDAIFAYTALGDNMNLGARLESLCKHYGAQILISEYTYKKMNQEKFQSRCIDKVKVKGKTEPVGVFEVLYSYHPLVLNPESFENFKQGYELYLQGKFAQAKEFFEKVLMQVASDKASQRLLNSCQHWMENPPKPDEDWTITTMTTK